MSCRLWCRFCICILAHCVGPPPIRCNGCSSLRPARTLGTQSSGSWLAAVCAAVAAAVCGVWPRPPPAVCGLVPRLLVALDRTCLRPLPLLCCSRPSGRLARSTLSSLLRQLVSAIAPGDFPKPCSARLLPPTGHRFVFPSFRCFFCSWPFLAGLFGPVAALGIRRFVIAAAGITPQHHQHPHTVAATPGHRWLHQCVGFATTPPPHNHGHHHFLGTRRPQKKMITDSFLFSASTRLLHCSSIHLPSRSIQPHPPLGTQ